MGQELVASHIALLTRVFTLSDDDVLELGTGYFSSLLLRWLSELSHRNVYAYESREHWYKKAKEKETQYYKVFYAPDYDDAPIDHKWGMVFVDHGPNKRRITEIKRLANLTDYIVIHDTNPELDREYHYSDIWDLFKYRYDFKLYYPSTTVVSNTIDLNKVQWI